MRQTSQRKDFKMHHGTVGREARQRGVKGKKASKCSRKNMEERELVEKGAGLRGLSAGTKTTNTALRCHEKDDPMTIMARETTQ